MEGYTVAERGGYMLAFLDTLLAMNDDITIELAWQMGRPVRYGGEKGGIEERTRAVVAMAEEALKPLPAGEGWLSSVYHPEAARYRPRPRTVELSLRAGVITQEATRTKKVIFHPKMMPKVVICDPELTVGMPPVLRTLIVSVNVRH